MVAMGKGGDEKLQTKVLSGEPLSKECRGWPECDGLLILIKLFMKRSPPDDFEEKQSLFFPGMLTC
jgi:hypothetical protein